MRNDSGLVQGGFPGGLGVGVSHSGCGLGVRGGEEVRTKLTIWGLSSWHVCVPPSAGLSRWFLGERSFWWQHRGNRAEGFFAEPSYSKRLSSFMGSAVFLFQPLRGRLLLLRVPALCAGPGAGWGEAVQMHGAVWSQEGEYHS